MLKYLSLLAISSLILSAGMAEDIVMDHLNKIGGLDKLKNIESIEVESTIISSITQDTSIAKMINSGNKYWLSQSIQGTPTIVIHNGEKGWTKGAFNGPNWGILNTQIWAQLSGQLDFNKSLFTSVLSKYDPKEDAVEFGGFEIWDGVKVNKIKLVDTTNTSVESFIYIEKESKLMKGLLLSISGGMQNIETRITFSDYKSINGILIPHKIKANINKMTQDITINSIKINPEIPDSKFANPMPKE